jgi:AhpD family alkylhydroperoxidase
MSERSLPKQYQALQRNYPEYMEAVNRLGAAVETAGPLEAKTRQLIQLAAAAVNRSEGAVHSHTRRALAAGASPEEIRHALLILTSTMGFPNVSAALTWVEDVLA